MEDVRSIEALDVAERYANGEATGEELGAARVVAKAAADIPARNNAAKASARDAACATLWDPPSTAASVTAKAAAYAVAVYATGDAVRIAEQREQLKILAEFGNPFEN